MNVIDRRILEFWNLSFEGFEWKRLKELEIELEKGDPA
jgi:hypothetical protein